MQLRKVGWLFLMINGFLIGEGGLKIFFFVLRLFQITSSITSKEAYIHIFYFIDWVLPKPGCTVGK